MLNQNDEGRLSVVPTDQQSVTTGTSPWRRTVSRLPGFGAKAPSESEAAKLEIRVSLEGVLALLAVGVVLITLASLVVNLVIPGNGDPLPIENRVYRFFDLNAEYNLPSWYQAFALQMSAILLVMIGTNVLRTRSWWIGGYWIVLGLGFLFLSLDEAVVIHEQMIDPVRDALDISGGMLFFAWVVPAVAAVALLGIAFIPFLRSLPSRTRYSFLLAGAFYVGGAIGMEAIGGAYASNHNVGVASSVYSFRYCLLYTVEELLEMLGVVLFLAAILHYMALNRATIELKARTKLQPDAHT